MTSDDTDAATRALLAAHANFGAAEGQITFIKQEKVPALADSDARLAVKEDASGVSALEMKPHGHGDVHVLLKQSGLAEKWLGQGARQNERERARGGGSECMYPKLRVLSLSVRLPSLARRARALGCRQEVARLLPGHQLALPQLGAARARRV